MSAPVTTAGGSSAADPLLPPVGPNASVSDAYASVLERLESLVNHEKRPQSARAWGLERVRKVSDRLGRPGDRYPTLHVTGTKGKGTTSHLMARLLKAGGRRVGLYTSPHVRDVRERIKIDGVPIDPAAFARAFDTVWNSFHGLVDENERPVSYFEMMTHTAFVAFEQAGVDIAVIEVGLGGTLDATNILTAPLACVLTPISLDHVKILGSTVEAIAQDKSGIIKPGAQVIVADQPAGAREAIHARAREIGTPRLWQIGRDVTYR
ncbi:MAG: bifunctional folylpolyglutamate synthase/dihydrofolate synthase, partial [Planctomycetota bacterium]